MYIYIWKPRAYLASPRAAFETAAALLCIPRFQCIVDYQIRAVFVHHFDDFSAPSAGSRVGAGSVAPSGAGGRVPKATRL